MRVFNGPVTASLLALALVGTPAAAQYPNKPITVIVPFAAGGPTDVVTRLVGDHMSRTLGQTLVVENIGGAGGTLGMTRAAQAQPDGYTIAVGNMGTQSAAPALYPNSQVRSGQELRAGRHRQPYAAVDRGQERHRGEQPERLHRIPEGQSCQADLRSCRRRLDLACVRPRLQLDVRLHAQPRALSRHRARHPRPGRRPDRLHGRPVAQCHSPGPGRHHQDLMPLPRRNGCRACPTCRPPGRAASTSSSAPGTRWLRPRTRRRRSSPSLPTRSARRSTTRQIQQRYVELGSSAPKGADRGPAGLQKLVESEVARITPVIKAAGVTAN